MTTKLWGAAAAALMLCAAPAALAKVMVADYSGVVTYTLGDTSLFGPTTGIGSAFDLIFRYDTDVGQLTDDLPDQVAILGGALVAPAGPSPMRAAVIRIDGVSRAFAPEAQGSIILDFVGGEILHSGLHCPSFCEGMSAEFRPTLMPASLTSNLDLDGTGQGDFNFAQGGRAVFAYLDLQHLTISAAPEPGVWLSLVGGLFGAGALLRRRKAPIPA